MYSWALLIQTRLFRIPRFFQLKTIPLGYALELFTVGYFELPLFWTVSNYQWEFETARFNCLSDQSERKETFCTTWLSTLATTLWLRHNNLLPSLLPFPQCFFFTELTVVRLPNSSPPPLLHSILPLPLKLFNRFLEPISVFSYLYFADCLGC